MVRCKLTCRFLGRLRKKKKRKQPNPWNQMIEQNLVIVTESAARKANVIPHSKALWLFLLHILLMTTTHFEKLLQPWCLSVPANKMTRRRLKTKGWFWIHRSTTCLIFNQPVDIIMNYARKKLCLLMHFWDCNQNLICMFLFPLRRCTRRHSARFESQEPEPPENLFEIETAQFPISKPFDNKEDTEAAPTLFRSSSSNREDREDDWASGVEEKPSRKSSISRPSRRAAEKVQSYKEIPLNIKMRRSG